MKNRRLGLVIAILICGFLLSCGNSRREDVSKKLAEINQELQKLEEKSTSGDDETRALIQESKEQLQRVQHAIIEDDYEKAFLILDILAQKINLSERSGKAEPQARGNELLRPFGEVEYRTGGSGFKRLSGSEKVKDIQAIRTGARSGLEMQALDQTVLLLAPLTECQILAVDPLRNHLSILLEKGELVVKKTDKGGDLIIKVQDNRLATDQPVKFEANQLSVAGRGYVAVHEGRLTWSEGGKNSNLEKYWGLKWEGSSHQQVATPISPNLDAPGNGQGVVADGPRGTASVAFRWETKALVSEYHLQISDQRHFFTRVFDRQNLALPSFKTELKPGHYYWRVRGFSAEGVPGPFSKTQELLVLEPGTDAAGNVAQSREDLPGPPLKLLKIEVISTMVIVGGRTSENAKVSVNGVAAVMMDEGNFRAIINFNEEGQHDLRILATDLDTGAETLAEKKVEIRY